MDSFHQVFDTNVYGRLPNYRLISARVLSLLFAPPRLVIAMFAKGDEILDPEFRF
jgi:hypothetical protein